MSAPETFDICGPLPTGTTLLEASAGTGKTFTIAALATRYVAEGIAPLSQLMLVTFGRAATSELRSRVRERLVDTERALADAVAARSSDDTLVRHLAQVPDDEVLVRRSRLAVALADFDAATIATTHGFCQQMLAGLGVAGDSDADAVFIESAADLVDEVVDDLYVARYGWRDAPEPVMAAKCARSLAHAAVVDRQAELSPADAEARSEAAERYAFACDVRAEVERRKRARRLIDYDDLLTGLRDALADPESGADARERVRSRYRVVMVDEFQDTDPVQWEVLRLAFHGTTTLVLIGDPKQAIYAFRGADVVTYLQAAALADTQKTLGRNWRSDRALLDGIDAVFARAALGDPRIAVRAVDAAHEGRRLIGAPAQGSLRLRIVPRSLVGCAPGKTPLVGPVRQCIATDVASDIVRLLDSGAVLSSPQGDRPVRPGDVAVLVRTNAAAGLVREALQDVRVPVVLSGATSVFATETADEWLVLLRALEQPHRASRVRAAALTCFLGWSVQQLADAGENAMDDLGPLLRTWADVLGSRGVAALLELVAATGLQARLLGHIGGERQLTDLRHIAEALHAAATDGQLGTAALVEWLQRRIVEAGDDVSEERSRRLESDADAVQVLTVHTSKGLEFPVVYVPFGWDRHQPASPDPLRFHDSQGQRMLDVGGRSGPHYGEFRSSHQTEDAGEDLRLLYVALTRAQCQVVAWWAPSQNSTSSGLSRLVLGRFETSAEPPASVSVPNDDTAMAAFAALAGKAPGVVDVEVVAPTAVRPWQPKDSAGVGLAAATFSRQLDSAWRRTSYSALTAGLHSGGAPPAGVASEPDAPEVEDEVVPPSSSTAVDQADGGVHEQADPTEAAQVEALAAVPSPMADLPSGATFGTLVHAVLEELDTDAEDLAAELSLRCHEQVSRRLSDVDPVRLADGLLPVLSTPLGPLAGGITLGDISTRDRLNELQFELPLAGGDSAGGDVAPAGNPTLADVADLLRRHLPPGDPLAGYAAMLDVPVLRNERLRGYLNGSLDAVLRVGRPAGEPRYLVVDYKTNWLGDWGPAGPVPLTAWHYRPAAMADAMMRAHYPLQFLLYTVALHRFLRWRQPGYDPDRHLGGVLYLFVRGMSGPETPLVDGTPCGVFGWRAPTALVEDFSRLLAGAS